MNLSTVEKRAVAITSIVGTFIAVITILCSAGATWTTSQVELKDHEKRISSLETDRQIDHDLIIEMHRDVHWVVTQMKGQP